MNKHYKIGKEVFDRSLLGVDIKVLPKKYISFEKNFNRVNKAIGHACSRKYKRGLDFGCGVGFPSVIGKSKGLDIVGLDIFWSKGSESPYLKVQKNLCEMGYDIRVADTNKLPWDFCDNEFDFVVALFSINKEFMHDSLDFKSRLKELKRITRCGGGWIIWPKVHYDTVLRHTDMLKDKNISIIFGG